MLMLCKVTVSFRCIYVESLIFVLRCRCLHLLLLEPYCCQCGWLLQA